MIFSRLKPLLAETRLFTQRARRSNSSVVGFLMRKKVPEQLSDLSFLELADDVEELHKLVQVVEVLVVVLVAQVVVNHLLQVRERGLRVLYL